MDDIGKNITGGRRKGMSRVDYRNQTPGERSLNRYFHGLALHHPEIAGPALGGIRKACEFFAQRLLKPKSLKTRSIIASR